MLDVACLRIKDRLPNTVLTSKQDASYFGLKMIPAGTPTPPWEETKTINAA